MNNTPPAHDAIENLLTVLDVVRAHAPAGVAEWLGDGVEGCLSDRGSLDQCLGIGARKQGSRHAARMLHAWQRNYYLMEAHGCIEDPAPWERSRKLSNVVSDFHQLWPRYQHLDAPESGWSDLRVALFNAFKYGSKYKRGLPPASQNRLHEIYLQHEQK